MAGLEVGQFFISLRGKFFPSKEKSTTFVSKIDRYFIRLHLPMIDTILNSRYQIIRQVGQGGLATAFIAEDCWQNHQLCVVKRLKPDVVSEATRYLFDKEAEYLCKLGHHHQIPQLLAHFQENQSFYIVQEFIEGKDLSYEIRSGKPLPEMKVVKLLIEILEIVEYVHENHVIHRDIKPANIIRRPDGKLVLIDFGGIKQVRYGEQVAQPLSVIIRTPGYAPIEQINNKAQFCSDIYAVGIIGIFALTGIDPDPRVAGGGFTKDEHREILWQDHAQVSSRLAEIINKMIKFDYRQRYQYVSDVLRDLKNLIAPQNWHCLQTLTGHTRSIKALAFSPIFRTKTGERTEIFASGSEDMTIRLWQLQTGKLIGILRGHSAPITGLAFSQNGKILISSSEDKTIKIWQLQTGKSIFNCTGHRDSITAITLSPDGQTLASCSSDQTIKLWHLKTGQEITTLKGHERWINCLAFSPDGTQLATGSDDETIKIWNLKTGQEINTLTGHHWSIEAIAFTANGQILASGSRDETIKLWDVKTGREIRQLAGHSGAVQTIAIHKKSDLLASGSRDKTIKLWQISTGKELCTLSGHLWIVNCLAFSNNHHTLISGSEDDTIKIWQVIANNEE